MNWTVRSMQAAISVAVALACAACAFPMSVYVAEPAAGMPVYERCSFNAHVPVAVKVDGPGVQVQVSVTHHFGHGFVEARYDVPPARTLILQRDTVSLDRRDGVPAETLRFPGISPAGSAAFSPDERSAALRQLALPVDTPLIGGYSSPGVAKHYWIAARFDSDASPDLWVTLPAFTVDGRSESWPPIHFRQRTMIATIGSNC